MSTLTSVTTIVLPVQCFNSEWRNQGNTSSPESRGQQSETKKYTTSFHLPSSDHPLPNRSHSTRPRVHYRYNRPQGHVCLCVTQLRPISPHFGLLELGNYKPGLSVLPCNYAGPGRNCRSWILLLWCTELMTASGLPCSHY